MRTTFYQEDFMTKTLPSLLVTGLLGLAGFAAFAQPAPMMDHGLMHPPHEMGRRDPAQMEQMINRQMNALKGKLKLAPEQEAAWTTFTTAVKPSGAMMEQRPDRAELDKLSTPERLDKMRALRTQHMAEMNALMDKRDEATKTFYAQLSTEQKLVFDAEHARRGQHTVKPRAKAADAAKGESTPQKSKQ
jgi:hypothetical protein